MRIGIAGSGRMGCSLALALAAKGADVAGVFSRKPEEVSAVFEGTGIVCGDDICSLVDRSDLVFLAVPDSAIEMFASDISELCGSRVSNKVFLHLSGALTSGVLKKLEELGAVTGSLHPIQTFPDREGSWKAMYGIYFGFEGQEEAGKAAKGIVEGLGGKMLVITPEAKPLYHAAACAISNYTVALSFAAGSLMEMAGIPGDTGMKALEPLLINTVRNIVAEGSVKALTGPISRGDTETVLGHIAALGKGTPQMAEVYKAMGRLTVRLALIKGTINEGQAAGLLEALA